MKHSTTLLALISLVLGACTTPGNPDGLAPGSHYVSLGSSFAAGAGIGPTRPDTPERCGRTINNYASLLAEQLHLALEDQGCGGARTQHILAPWNELPAQIEAVTADTRLVTITIGGNDLNYVGALFRASCTADGKSLLRPAEPCGDGTSPTPADYAKTEENLRTIAAEVKRRAPDATLVLVQYVTLVPDTLCEATPLSPVAADTIRDIGRRLAEITARIARQSGAILIPADQLSRHHTPCDSQPWAIGFPPNYDRAMGAPWHPNGAGHAAIAEAIARRLSSVNP